MEQQDVADLSGVMPVDASVLEILKPGSGEGTGWKITFAGPSHPKTVAWLNGAARRAIARQQRLEQAQANGRKYRPEEREPDDLRRENVEVVTARILDWTPVRVPSVSQDAIAFSEKAAAELLLRPDMGWAFAQMIEFLAEERSFTPRSATN